jgi:antitoxin (DNA-binding transcriptional repressor) of toxin-antitoxin stability system
MKTTTIRELKHATSTVLSWVANGESVEVRRHNEPDAVLSPPNRKGRIARPDFKGRLRAIYGNKTLAVTGSGLIAESRGES